MTIEAAHHGAAAPRSRLHRFLILSTVMVASAMYVTDIFVISIALPHMQGTFSATPDQIAWVAVAFVLGTTAMIVATGWISARVGGRRLFILSLVGVAVMMVLCANATTLQEEVLWRFLMGAIGAPVQPLCQVIILNTYPREQHGRVLAIWGMFVMLAPAIALPIAGVVIDAVGWPGVFYMNLPVAGIAIIGALAFVPKAEAEPTRRLDWFGLVMLVLVFCALQFVLSRGARLDWFESVEIVIALAVSVICAYLFVVHLLTTRNPLVPPEIFRDRNFTFGLVGTFAFAATNMIVTILLPLMLRNQLGYPIDLVGLIMAPRTAGTVLGQYVMALLIMRTDPRHLITLGALTSATATWIMSGWTLDVSPWQVIWPAILHGMSGGMLWVGFNSITPSTLERRHRQQGVPVWFLCFNVGFSVGVATILTYWANSTQANYAMLTEFVTPFNELFWGQALPPGWNPADPAIAATLADEISRQAAMIAFNNCFIVTTIAALCIIPLGYLLRDPGWRRPASTPAAA